MTNEQKKQVRDALLHYASSFGTEEQVADSLQGISISTISQVKNNNWELLSERMWHHIARQLGFNAGEWQPADTSAYLLLRIILNDAQHYAMTYGVAIAEGLGKTFTANHYARENDNTFYVAGNPKHTQKSFLKALMNAIGVKPKGTSQGLMKRFAEHVNSTDNSLVIIDDADKLKGKVLQLAIALSNSLRKSGIVFMGSDKLRAEITKGVRLKKAGFDEIYTSMRQRIIALACPGPKDVDLVCRANGVHDEVVIEYIVAECDNLHKATRLIQQYNEMNKAA